MRFISKIKKSDLKSCTDEGELVTLDEICGGELKVYQPKKGYRFSVDALLLANFIKVKRIDTAADLGCGCGIISLILAKKWTPKKILGIELQKNLYEIAKMNTELNNLQEIFEVMNADYTKLRNIIKAESFDIIISNPPFRKPVSGKISPYHEKAVARHETAMDIESLISSSAYLVKYRGKTAFIYNADRTAELIYTMKKYNIEPKRLRFVHSKSALNAELVMIEGVKGGKPSIKVEKPFIVYKNVESDSKVECYTEEARKIYYKL